MTLVNLEASPPSPEKDDDTINLLAYWQVLRDRRWVIAGVTAAVLLLALAATLLATPIFRASSTLQIERDTMKIMDVEGLTPTESPMDRDFYQTQYELLRSRSLARRVVQDLQATLVDVRAAAAGARAFMDSSGPQLTAAAERFRVLADNLAKTTGHLDKLMADHREDLGLFLRDSLPEMERLLRDSRVAAQEIRELSRSLKADPSQLLYEPSYRGVEIPK